MKKKIPDSRHGLQFSTHAGCEIRFNLLVLRTNDGLSGFHAGQLIYKNVFEDRSTDDRPLLVDENGFFRFFVFVYVYFLRDLH